MKDISLTPPQNDSYGIAAFERAPHQLTREMSAYVLTRGRFGRDLRAGWGIKLEETGLKSPLQHMVNIIGFLWPNDVILKARGIVNTNALEILEALCNDEIEIDGQMVPTHNDVGIVGNASSGKTRIMSAFICADWLPAPNCTSTFIATTSLESAEDRLWGQTSHLYRCAMKQAKVLMGKNATIGQLIDYRKMIVYGDVNDKDASREYSNAIKALAFPPGAEGQKAVDTTRGRKNKRVRMFIDELPEMESYALSVRANLSANPDTIFSAAGNPSHKANNPHKELCQPDDAREWESVNRNCRNWRTRTGVCVFLSGERSPNFKVPLEQSPPFPFLLTREMEQDILKKCYGNKNSLEYWRNVIGFWPGTEVEQTVLTRSFIKNAWVENPRWSPRPMKRIAGFDTGFTIGGDACVLTLGDLGEDENMRKVAKFISQQEFQADVNEVFEESIARKLVKVLVAEGVDPTNFGMDISGDGGKMAQAIIKEWLKYNSAAVDIVAISSMGAPTERSVSSEDLRKCCDVYDRIVTEFWFAVRNAILTKTLIGIDVEVHRELVTQLCSRLYDHSGKKIKIETKTEMKKRTRKSPDWADSAVYFLQMCRRAGLDFISPDEEANTEFIRKLERRFIGQDAGDEDREEEFSYASDAGDPDGF